MKVKQVKFLQFFTVVVFIVIIVVGLVVLFLVPERMDKYKEFVGAIWPIFIAEVIPAFLGTPITEAVKKINGKCEANRGED